jgi:hypothetical protein
MKLSTKPDFEATQRRWEAFWRGEVPGRPALHIVVPKEGVTPGQKPGQLGGQKYGFRRASEMVGEWAETHTFLAEALPYFMPTMGPDQFAAFFGAQIHDSPDSPDTNWIEPFVENWEDVMPFRFDESNAAWQQILEYVRIATEVAGDRFFVGQLDYHGNMDCLSAMRSPSRLCMDLIENPEAIQKALWQVTPLFRTFYDAIYNVGKMDQRGTIGWTPFYSRKRFATIQCDFVCMISPAMSRKFVIPTLEYEAEQLDHCAYHFDGPGAIPHLDDICGIKRIDVIQWVEGAGNDRHIKWIELFKRFQKWGKGLQINGTPDEVKEIHRQLRPEKVLYCVSGVKTEKEGHELIKWFEQHT